MRIGTLVAASFLNRSSCFQLLTNCFRQVNPSDRPSFSRAEARLRAQRIKLQPQLGLVVGASILLGASDAVGCCPALICLSQGSRKGSLQLAGPPRLSTLSSHSSDPTSPSLSDQFDAEKDAPPFEDDAANLPTRDVQAWVSCV